MAMSVYAGTTLSEAQKIINGDYSAFDWRARVTYSRVYLGMNPAIRDAENALDSDEDKPVIVALLLKSEKMLVKDRVRRLSAIKAARIIPDAELLKRTGYLFDNEKLIGLPEGIVMRASNGVYIVQCDAHQYQCSLRGKRDAFSTNQQVYVGDRVKIQVIDETHGTIAAVMRRKSQYKRRGTQSKGVILIPNLDGLVIVSSVKEPPIWQRMLDKFLVIAEASGIEPLICLNKMDMLEKPIRRGFDSRNLSENRLSDNPDKRNDRRGNRGFESVDERQDFGIHWIIGGRKIFAPECHSAEFAIENQHSESETGR